jgi:hypothetical protein
MAIIAMILAVEDRFVFEVSTTFVYAIVPRVIVLIDLCQAGISPLQRHPASITRATIRPSGNSASFFENVNRA